MTEASFEELHAALVPYGEDGTLSATRGQITNSDVSLAWSFGSGSLAITVLAVRSLEARLAPASAMEDRITQMIQGFLTQGRG